MARKGPPEKEGQAMNRRKQSFRNEHERHDRFEQPLPLYLPLPEPPLLDLPSNKKEREEKTERGIWIIDI
jgi:hypothetical protein